MKQSISIIMFLSALLAVDTCVIQQYETVITLNYRSEFQLNNESLKDHLPVGELDMLSKQEVKV